MRLKAMLQVRNGSRSLLNDYKRFYARQHVMLSASLLRQRRPSVCPSHCCTVSKRRNLGSWNLHCGLPQGLVFLRQIFVPLGEGIPLERGHQTRVPPTPVKSRHFTTIGSSSVKTVAHRHRLDAYHNKHCWRAFQWYQHRWPWTTLNPQNRGF